MTRLKFNPHEPNNAYSQCHQGSRMPGVLPHLSKEERPQQLPRVRDDGCVAILWSALNDRSTLLKLIYFYFVCKTYWMRPSSHSWTNLLRSFSLPCKMIRIFFSNSILILILISQTKIASIDYRSSLAIFWKMKFIFAHQWHIRANKWTSRPLIFQEHLISRASHPREVDTCLSLQKQNWSLQENIIINWLCPRGRKPGPWLSALARRKTDCQYESPCAGIRALQLQKSQEWTCSLA